MISSDARNKEIALARIKRLTSSGLPLEPFVRTVCELINDAIPGSPNQTFHPGSPRSDAYICSTSEAVDTVPKHDRYFGASSSEILGARYRIDVLTMRRLSRIKPVWAHEEIALPNFFSSAGYNEVFRPIRWHHSLLCFFQEFGNFAGCYPIWRESGQKPFVTEDIAFMQAVAPHIAHGLKIAQVKPDNGDGPESKFLSLAGYSSGSILLDDKGRPIAMDAQARLIFQQIGVLDGLPVDAFHLPQIRDALAYMSATLNDIFHDPDSGLTKTRPPVTRVNAHWSGIVLKLRGVHMMGPDGREYTMVLVERGETAESRRRRMNARWGLSQREAEVLDLICDNKTGPEIAILLTLSHDTVRKHTSAILAKLGVETRAAAIAAVREFA